MSANAFRSPLMQQIVAAARSQHRPPLAFSEFGKKSDSPTPTPTPRTIVQRHSCSLSHHNKSDLMTSRASNFRMPSIEPSFPEMRPLSSSAATVTSVDTDALNLQTEEQADNYSSFQNMIKTRRTTSNYNPIDFSDMIVSRLQDSMERGIRLGTTAPNHRRTELTTYYRIVANTDNCNQLLNICYNVALCKNLKTKTKQEAQINAESKKEKWKNTICGFIVVCVGSQPMQDDQYPYKSISTNDATCNGDDFDYWYDAIPLRPPQTERQLDDYASACASIQNILLSLHSEDWGSKWASGPMIRCRALRHLVGCNEDDAITGLIMVGNPKATRIPKPWRRRRDFSDVMRDL